MEAGNANRTKIKGGQSKWTSKVYRKALAIAHYEVEVSISHSNRTKVSQESSIRETASGYRKNLEEAMRV